MSVYECGIYISAEDPYLAATPDRVCYDPREENPWGIIEVKCPFNARDMTLMEASQRLNNFMSTIKDGVLDLKITHDYYLQIQGQMAIAGATWCDFVIYTKKECQFREFDLMKNSGNQRLAICHLFLFGTSFQNMLN